MSNLNGLAAEFAGLWQSVQLKPASPRRHFLAGLVSIVSGEFETNFSRAERSEAAERFCEELERKNIKFLTRFCAEFPLSLAVIPDVPPVIYFRGVTKYSLGVAVVGSRNPSSYGSEVAAKVSGDLSRLGLTVVSGLARGIDGIAHGAAVAAATEGCTAAPTIAVLGSGLNRIYPNENRELAERIVAAGGCVISELPPEAGARPHYFPMRNRIISGLSEATLVVEARDRSGSLITARCALDQGRDVLVVPGKIDSESFRGSNGLLRDGARPFLDLTDIFACLSMSKLSSGTGCSRNRGAESLPICLTLEESAVLSALGESEELTVDELSQHTGLGPQMVAASTTGLLMKTLIMALPGQRYVRAAAGGSRNVRDPSL